MPGFSSCFLREWIGAVVSLLLGHSETDVTLKDNSISVRKIQMESVSCWLAPLSALGAALGFGNSSKLRNNYPGNSSCFGLPPFAILIMTGGGLRREGRWIWVSLGMRARMPLGREEDSGCLPCSKASGRIQLRPSMR